MRGIDWLWVCMRAVWGKLRLNECGAVSDIRPRCSVVKTVCDGSRHSMPTPLFWLLIDSIITQAIIIVINTYLCFCIVWEMCLCCRLLVEVKHLSAQEMLRNMIIMVLTVTVIMQVGVVSPGALQDSKYIYAFFAQCWPITTRAVSLYYYSAGGMSP